VGSGKMGGSIFRALLHRSHDLVLCGTSAERVGEEQKKVKRSLRRSVRRGELTDEDAQARLGRLCFTSHLQQAAGADLVVEAVPEAMELKMRIFRDLESIVSPECLLTTNTSCLSIGQMAGHLRLPHRFCGLHFFHPVMLIPLVEIITASGTSPDVVQSLETFCRDLGKQPVTVRDAPGSAINRVLAHYYLEALYMLEEGVALPSRIDAVARRHCYLGPCESLDALGLDFFASALEISASGGPGADGGNSDAHGLRAPRLLPMLLARNRLGKRTCRGVYVYDGDRALDDEPDVYAQPGDAAAGEATSEEIEKRLIYAVCCGALHMIDRSVATREALDAGVRDVLLMKQGPFTLMGQLGAQAVRAELEQLADRLGPRFAQSMVLEHVM